MQLLKTKGSCQYYSNFNYLKFFIITINNQK